MINQLLADLHVENLKYWTRLHFYTIQALKKHRNFMLMKLLQVGLKNEIHGFFMKQQTKVKYPKKIRKSLKMNLFWIFFTFKEIRRFWSNFSKLMLMWILGVLLDLRPFMQLLKMVNWKFPTFALIFIFLHFFKFVLIFIENTKYLIVSQILFRLSRDYFSSSKTWSRCERSRKRFWQNTTLSSCHWRFTIIFRAMNKLILIN